MSWNPQPTLTGLHLTLRPLREADFDDLYAVASDPLIWAQHPAWNRYELAVFRTFVDEALAGGSAFVAINNATGAIIGSSRYHGYNAEAREVEIGWTFLGRAYWGGAWNREMKRLMLEHAFQYVDRVLFNVGPNNIRSQTAMERIGGTRVGQVVDAVRGDRVVFEMRKENWEGIRERLS
ncbi:MAG: GNAT family N-acetyltransferase [Gemmatimonadaceae bacterium]|nr:GNAT family N-acetyltransferase [Gemmatimonadaceae bacterium]